MLKSATFMIGLLLALGAFVGFLLLGNFLAPPPAQVVVALRDIPPYTPLDQNMLGVDAQHLNGQVLATLVQKEELAQYVGGFVTTPIFAGEPLRKSAVVTAGNPLASKRLALAMNDPHRVAAVIPVDAKTSPTQIVTGDYIDLVISMAPGNLTGGNSNQFGKILAGQESNQASFGFGPAAVITPTRGIFPTSSIFPSGIISGPLAGAAMNLPVTKAVIRDVPVLGVSFEQTPNPTYASAGFGEDANSGPPQPAYIEGAITSITVSIPRDSAELLNFGIDNGKVHVLLLPVQEGQTEFATHKEDPTLGVSWNDVLAFMIQERQELTVALNPSTAENGAPSGTNTSAPNPTGAAATNPKVAPTTAAKITATPTLITTPNAKPTATQVAELPPPTTIAGSSNDNANGNAVPTPAQSSTAPQQNQLPTGLDVMSLVVPLACGLMFLILGIIVIRVIRRRRMSHVTP